jgi:FtsH-binding integral membrane protein
MDDQKKEQFRWKFYRLTLQLNAVILLAALIVIAFFITPEPYRIPLVLVMILLEAYLSFTFTRKYRQTRLWLDEHADTKKPP